MRSQALIDMKTVMVFGTFDFLHIGHLHFLNEAKKLGSKLIVVVARDGVVLELKGKEPIHNEQERIALLSNLKIIDEVTLGDRSIGTYRVLKKNRPDIVAIGYDQTAFFQDIKEFIEKTKNQVEIKQITPYSKKNIKSSDLRKILPL